MPRFPNYLQTQKMDCGPVSLKIIARYHGIFISLAAIRKLSSKREVGVSLLDLMSAARKIGFRAATLKVTYSYLKTSIPLPCIVHWRRSHFTVVYRINTKDVCLSDSTFGRIRCPRLRFIRSWTSKMNTKTATGYVLALSINKKILPKKT